MAACMKCCLDREQTERRQMGVVFADREELRSSGTNGLTSACRVSPACRVTVDDQVLVA